MDDDVRQAYLVVGTLFALAWLGELLPSDAPALVMSLGILVASVIGTFAWSAWANRWNGNREAGRKTPKLRGCRRSMHSALKAVIVRPLRIAAQRRELAELSDRQLRDAGIDPALAGRDKMVAVDRSALLRLLALSYG